MYTGSFACLAQVGASIWNYWGLIVLISVGQSLITQTVWTCAIAIRFRAARGVALAVTLCGASLGSITTPLIAEPVIASYGFRAAYVALAVVAAGLSLPILLRFFRVPAPSRIDAPDAKARAPDPSRLDRSRGLRSRRFWSLAVVGFCATSSVVGLVVHFVPVVTDRGLSRAAAAAAVGLVGIGSIAGRLIEGFLLDRFPGALVGSISLLLPIAAGSMMLSFDGSALSASAIALVLGLALGAETNILAYLTSRYFGVSSFGSLFGIIVGCINFGAGVGPLLAGLVYDATGTYQSVLWGVMAISVVCSALIMTLGPYPKPLPVVSTAIP
jgi:predicted MFS family arabinose efflux permease